MALTDKKCGPCEGGVPPLASSEVKRLRGEIEAAWEVVGEKKLRREWRWQSFAAAAAWVNRVADLAEQEGHHPDLHWYYRTVVLELTTHAINGLSENDFILAAKIDQLGGVK